MDDVGDGNLDNRYVGVLREFDPQTINPTETEQGIKHPTYGR